MTIGPMEALLYANRLPILTPCWSVPLPVDRLQVGNLPVLPGFQKRKAIAKHHAPADRLAFVVAGARHELLMEQDQFRGQFLAAFDAFVPGSALFG